MCVSVLCVGFVQLFFAATKKYLIELHARWAQQGMCVFIYSPLVFFFAVTVISHCHHSLVKLLSTNYCDNLYVFHIRAFFGFLHKCSNIVTTCLSQYLTNLMHKICFTISFISCLYMFRAHVLIIRRSKLHYTASGIITPIGVIIPEAV